MILYRDLYLTTPLIKAGIYVYWVINCSAKTTLTLIPNIKDYILNGTRAPVKQ